MMRLLFLLLVLNAATAQNDAVAAYRRGDYAIADALFSSSPNAETDAGILANRANCAFRLGRFADALVFFRRAELRDPSNRDIVDNRRRAESRLGLETSDDANAAGSIASWRHHAGHPMWVVLFSAIECIGLWTAFYGRRRSARIGIVLAAAALFLGGASILLRLVPRDPIAIVVAKEAVVRAEPHADRRSVVLLGAGETVTVEMMSDRWMKISHRRGAGWIERGAAMLVE